MSEQKCEKCGRDRYRDRITTLARVESGSVCTGLLGCADYRAGERAALLSVAQAYEALGARVMASGMANLANQARNTAAYWRRVAEGVRG